MSGALTASDFAAKAGFPEKWKERHLQDYIIDKLRSWGYQAKAEVELNHGRADVITDWMEGAVIEVKPYLSREAMLQAAGQTVYYGLNNNLNIVLAGLLPEEFEAANNAINTKKLLEQNKRISVLFVNMYQEWLPGSNYKPKTNQNSFSLWQWKLPSVNLSNWQKWLLQKAIEHPLIVIILVGFIWQTISKIPIPPTKNEYHQNTKSIIEHKKPKMPQLRHKNKPLQRPKISVGIHL